ncbi:unnamed protein product [Linum tenue]|uniref:Protein DETOXIFICATION n=1 Tax=Linum tenue TaxID=586396 RepID=A0AAV0GRF5_9ROSI|nr:unnamed protein product [Linum tenue]
MADDEESSPPADFHSHPRPPPSLPQILEELKELWSMAFPVTASHLTAFFRSAVSVIFLGRLGSLELAGGALSIGFTNITGYSVMVGLASGLEPVCSQAYGSKNWDLLHVSLQRMVLILCAAAAPITFLWLNLRPIMVFLGQDPDIASTAATYCLYALPDLWTNALLQPLRVYLRSQNVTKPVMYCSIAAVALHAPLNYLAVAVLGLGVRGVAMAAVVTNVNTVGLMIGYMWWARRRGGGGRGEWKVVGWSGGGGGDGGGGMGALLRLAVPSCVGICLEWWWYEVVTVMAGYLPDPTLAVAATGILIQTTSMMYTLPMALAGCVSARVGNELGAGNPDKAKLAATVALGCAFVIGVINVLWTVILRERWAGLFTKDDLVKGFVSSVLPIIGLCELGNCPQTTGCGVLRGTARPAIAARINLGSFYFIGTPVAVGLAFGLKVGFPGLWFGLLSAQVACVVSILYVIWACTDWEHEALKARNMTQIEMVGGCNHDDHDGGGNEENEEGRGLLMGNGP